MKRAGVALALLAACPALALAQVSTDTRALDALAPARTAKPAAASHHAPPGAPPRHRASAGHASAGHAPAGHAAVHTAGTRALPARIAAPTMAPHPPPIPVIAPPALHVPLHPPPPPPPVPVDPKADGSASAIAGGTRLAFAAGGAALNPAMIDALHAQSAAMKANADDVATIDAYAPGAPDDPSTPRRLSLQRALAARAVLINDGIASTRIYARALGVSLATAAPPDRLDLTLAPVGGAAPDVGGTAKVAGDAVP